MAKLSTEDLLDQFKEMTLIELSEFVKAFEEAFDVKAAAPMAMAAAAPVAAEAAEEVEEQSAVYWGTLAIGGPKLLDKQEMDTILQRFKSYGQKS